MTTKRDPKLESWKSDKAALVLALTEAGATFKGNRCSCPFHDDKHPSAGIFMQADTGFWLFKCQACQFKGSVVDVLMKHRGKSFKDIVAEHFPTTAPAKTYSNLDALVAHLGGRVESIFRYTSSFVSIRVREPEGKSFCMAWGGDGQWRFGAPPKPWPLFNLSQLKDADTVVVVEGEKKVQCLGEYGIVATCSIGGASAAASSDWSALAGKKLVLWPDADVPGGNYMDDVTKQLQKNNPPNSFARINPAALELTGKEDVCDLVQQMKSLQSSPEQIREFLQNAVMQAPTTVDQTALAWRQELQEQQLGRRQPIRTPWHFLNGAVRPLLPGSIFVLAGNPSAAKTFFVYQALAQAIDDNVPVRFFALEENVLWHWQRAWAQRAEKAELLNEKWLRSNPEQVKDYVDCHKDYERQFLETTVAPATSLHYLELSGMVDAEMARGCKLIIVDPFSAVEQQGREIWIEQSWFINSVKRSADKYKAAVLLVCHPVKQYSNPDLGQLMGGAALQRFTSAICWLHYHKEKASRIQGRCGTVDGRHNRTLMVLKARNGVGAGWPLAYNFDTQTLRFVELGVMVKGVADD